MKKVTGAIAVLLSAAMLFGCGEAAVSTTGNAAASEPAAAEEAVTVEEEVTSAAESTAEEAAPAAAEGPVKMDELTSINVFIQNNTSASPERVKKIEDAINAISEDLINVHINLESADTAAYQQSLPLKLASGESIDMVGVLPLSPVTLSQMYSGNQLMDISEYLEEYGPDILSTVGDYLDAVTIDGGVYMVPNVRNYASSLYYVCPKEYIDGLGLKDDFDNMETIDDLEAILQAITEEYGIPAMSGGQSDDQKIFYHGAAGVILNAEGNFEDSMIFDSIGDTLFTIGVDENGQVFNAYGTDAFQAGGRKAKEWYDQGWIYKDAPISTEGQEIIMKNSAAASMIVTSELGVEAAKESVIQKPLYAKKLVGAYVTSGVVARFGTAVPVTANEPEAAVCFMNLLMTNGDINNILYWGIEGEDWQENNGEAEYVTDKAEWHPSDFRWGNTFTAYPWIGSGADNRIRAKAENDAAPVSPYLGFTLDSGELSNTIAALTSVLNTYQYSLSLGEWSDEKYDQFMTDMGAAGIDEYMAEAQAQLDAWLGK